MLLNHLMLLLLHCLVDRSCTNDEYLCKPDSHSWTILRPVRATCSKMLSTSLPSLTLCCAVSNFLCL